MGNYSEFRRVYSIIEKRTDFDANINVSVFETNIRIVGGLLAAHLVARRAGVEVKNKPTDGSSCFTMFALWCAILGRCSVAMFRPSSSPG